MKKFWDWIVNDEGERVLRIDGPIDEESLWGDEITPEEFREELESGEGDIIVWINSPGGNVFAAAEIYTMLKDYAGQVTVKIDALAASAASVVAMAGDKVQMSPVGMMMIHDPTTVAAGNAKDMEHAISVLTEVKEAIINAYEAKTGLSHARIAGLMENESWMNAKEAVKLGFADEILFENTEESEEELEEEEIVQPEALLYSGRQMNQMILNRLGVKEDKPADEKKSGSSVPEKKKEPGRGPSIPVIGMDGRTKDGSVPYLILKKQLECLR